jgi:hypothetical protein
MVKTVYPVGLSQVRITGEGDQFFNIYIRHTY